MYQREMTITIDAMDANGLPDLDCNVCYEWRRAEPDVGIMRPFPEDVMLRRPITGEWMGWAEALMTSDEWEKLELRIQEEHDEAID